MNKEAHGMPETKHVQDEESDQILRLIQLSFTDAGAIRMVKRRHNCGRFYVTSL